MGETNVVEAFAKPRPVSEYGINFKEESIPSPPYPAVVIDREIKKEPYRLEVDKRAIGLFLHEYGLGDDEIWKLTIKFTNPSIFSFMAEGRYNPLTNEVLMYPGGLEQNFWYYLVNIEQVVTGDIPSGVNLHGIRGWTTGLINHDQKEQKLWEINKKIQEQNKKVFDSLKDLKEDKPITELIKKIEEEGKSGEWKPQGRLADYRNFVRTHRLPEYLLDPNTPPERKIKFAKRLLSRAASKQLNQILVHELGHVLQFQGIDKTVALMGLSYHTLSSTALITSTYLAINYISSMPNGLEKALLGICLGPAALVAGFWSVYYPNPMERGARKFQKTTSKFGNTNFISFIPNSTTV